MPAIVWDANDGKPLFSLGADDDGGCRAVYSPDGEYIATGWPSLAVWDAETGKCLRILREDISSERRVSFSSDGRRLLSVHASEEDACFVWDIATGRQVAALGRGSGQWGHTFLPRPGLMLAWQGDFSVGSSWRVCVVRESDGSIVLNLTDCRSSPERVYPSPDGRRIAAPLDEYDGLGLWSLETGECLAELLPRDELVTGVSFSADGRSLAVGSDYRALLYRRRRPEWWWGVFWLWEFWLTAALATAFVWSLVADRRRLARANGAAA